MIGKPGGIWEITSSQAYDGDTVTGTIVAGDTVTNSRITFDTSPVWDTDRFTGLTVTTYDTAGLKVDEKIIQYSYADGFEILDEWSTNPATGYTWAIGNIECRGTFNDFAFVPNPNSRKGLVNVSVVHDPGTAANTMTVTVDGTRSGVDTTPRSTDTDINDQEFTELTQTVNKRDRGLSVKVSSDNDQPLKIYSLTADTFDKNQKDA